MIWLRSSALLSENWELSLGVRVSGLPSRGELSLELVLWQRQTYSKRYSLTSRQVVLQLRKLKPGMYRSTRSWTFIRTRW